MFRLAHLLAAADPENIAQEAFARLHTRWGELSDRSAAGGYVRTTVVNLVRSAARHQAVAQRHDATHTARSTIGYVPSAESSAVGSADAVLDGALDAELIAALRALSPRHREALVLRFWLDLSEKQMVEAMDCSTGTVKSLVSRGLSVLRQTLAEAVTEAKARAGPETGTRPGTRPGADTRKTRGRGKAHE